MEAVAKAIILFIKVFPFRGHLHDRWMDRAWLRYHLQADHQWTPGEADEVLDLCIEMEYFDSKQNTGWHDFQTSSTITSIKLNTFGYAITIQHLNAQRFQAALQV